MNPEYVVLGGLFWKIIHKKVCLWFVHKSTNLYLRIANIFVKHIFTSSKESYNINSSKKIYMNHGVDTSLFFYKNREKNLIFKILLVGRITPIKNQKLLIQAIYLLKKDLHFDNFILDIVGNPIYEKDKQYLLEVKEMINIFNLDKHINFLNNCKINEVPGVYNSHDLSINLCPTGGMDKVVLESLACGTPVIVFNKAFSNILKNYKELFILDNESREELSKKIFDIVNLNEEEKNKITQELSNHILKNFDLKNVITKLINYYE